jgi:NADH-quinone oxidoreductase subunit N
MMMDFNLAPLLPEIFLSISAMGLLVLGVFRGNDSTPVITGAAILALFLAGAILLFTSWQEIAVLNAMFQFDGFAGVLKILILAGLIASLALSVSYLRQENLMRFEYPVLVLLAGVGMMLMISSHNLLALYVALELQSLSLYVLAAFSRKSIRSAEAGVKYFTLGALSSGMLLFGISLIYGFAGTLDFAVIDSTLTGLEAVPIGVTFGLVFILAGLAFKISAVPFHMWTPDVYEGSPTSVTALFAIVPKLAAMGLLMRLLYEPFGSLADQWGQIILLLSAASMAVGALAGIMQNNIKRLLAYSSIGHMGYALIGVLVGTAAAADAVILYLFIYMVMSAGTFALLISLRRDGQEIEKISDMAGLSASHPVRAYALAVLMFSMSGIPPLAGFFAKFVIFTAAIDAGMFNLAILGVLASVVAAYYYLRVIKVMFFDVAQVNAPEPHMAFGLRAVALIALIFVMGFVFAPGLIGDLTANASAGLF